MADLTQQELQFLQGPSGSPTVTPPPPAGGALAVPQAPGLSSEELQFLNAKPATGKPPEAATAAPASTPVGEPPGILSALEAGAWGGAGSVIGGIHRLTGLGPAPGSPALAPTPDEQAAVAAHPYWAGAGRIVGQLGATAIPVAFVGGAATGLSEAAGLGALGAGVLGGAASGATANLLTSGEAPDENLLRRGFMGAVTGGALGGIAGKVGQWFGRDATLASPAVQDAGNLARSHGIDLTAQNLPQAGATAATWGAPASVAQQQQINRAFGRILGEDVSDFGPATLGNVTQRIGGQISAAANQGQVTLTPQLGNALGQIVQDARSTAYDPTVTGKIEQEVSKIVTAFQKGNGVIPGSQFDTIVGAGSRLQKYTNAADDDLSGLARRLDSAMDNGFQASSPVGAYSQWVDARTRYRLLSAIEDNVEHTGGNINAGSIYADLNRRFPNLPRLTAATGGTVGQAGDLANAVRTMFGGSAPQAVQQPMSPLKFGLGALGLGAGGEAMNYLMSPSSLANTSAWTIGHLPGVAAAGGLLAARYAAQRAGQAYQQSPAFANALLARGTSRPTAAALLPWLAGGGTAALPSPSGPGP